MTRSPLPQLVRFLMIHAGIGFALAGLFTLCLIRANPGDIGTLLNHADGYPLPTILLWFLLGLTSSSCQMGAAIMLLGEPPHDGGHSQRFDRLLSLFRISKSAANRDVAGYKV